MTYLPPEVLYTVCTELLDQEDLHTLFNCICSGKQLASIAVTKLYLMQDVAPKPPRDEPGRNFYNRIGRRWTGFWRTIILSSLGKTMYPYSQYIQTFDCANLFSMVLECDRADFFQGPLARKNIWGCLSEATDRIGEDIAKQTPLLGEFIGNDGVVTSGALSRWIPRLPGLRYLKSLDGVAMEGIGTLIRLHCPSFKGLEIQGWKSGNPDQCVADFLNSLRPQSLRSFKSPGSSWKDDDNALGPKSLQAISCHRETLAELKLEGRLLLSTISNVWLLKGCTNLVSLSLDGVDIYDDLEGNRFCADLDKSHNTVFLDLVAWLKECKKLQILSLTNIFSAPALMASAFSENSFYLTSLESNIHLTRYSTRKFHQALANQTSLQSLKLDDWDYDVELDAEVLVEALSKLVNLTILFLAKSRVVTFVDRHIKQLASSLPKLEVLSTGGDSFTDAIWDEVASLRSLRGLDLRALTSFTADGILDFIEKLGPGNKGLIIVVVNHSESDLSRSQKELIQETIATKLKGAFEFTCWPVGYR